MYARAPTAEELDLMGFRPEDYEDEIFEMWPENEAAISLFASISTQWRVGSGGPTGLDYNVLFYRMDRMHLSDEAHQQLFDDLRVIEAEALRIMTQKND